ncbi:tetratricopeptide repeat protein [Mycobacterium sp. URHD0025]|uniref:tetratricopeptide repeat protein n=1 Tax=Mycobacterium sp. URHD0025 TaxID=1298864 RepID=UPI0012DDED9A|nr:tetratricopeptide repeat protein [Mycobacterium sp. URHD0025]
MDLLEAQASVLSVAPAFDNHVAAGILGSSEDWLTRFGGGDKTDPITSLRLAGLLVEWSGVMRIADPLKSELASRLAAESPATYRACAHTFSAHARNGFHTRLAQVLGDRGAAVSVAVLDVAGADPDSESSSIRSLIATLQTSSSRPVDTAAAIRQLSQSPARRTTTDRLAAFLTGLHDWRLGRHDEASHQLELVLASRRDDQIEAIARHLVGVYRAEQRDFDSSLLYLETASDLLRRLGDRRGLTQALTSFGRVLAGSAMSHVAFPNKPDFETEQLVRAAKILDEAIAMGQDLHDNVLAGRAILELARVEYASERIDAAIDLAEDAARVLSHHQPDLVNVYTYMGTWYREAGRTDEAREVLRKAAEIAEKSGSSDAALGRILNVQASADRRAGLTDEAIRNARDSVEIGRRLGDNRHTAHALHTLAASLLDLNTQEAQKEAILLLNEARALLEHLGDSKGVGMVDTTLARTLGPHRA